MHTRRYIRYVTLSSTPLTPSLTFVMYNYTELPGQATPFLTPFYSTFNDVWASLSSIDRASVLNLVLGFAAISTAFHYAQDTLYAAARKTCIASVRINDDNLLFRYLVRYLAGKFSHIIASSNMKNAAKNY